MHGLIHRHIHKRKNLKIETPADSYVWNFILDKITIIAGIIGPVMVFPQLWKIYYEHNAHGVSALSWFAFGILSIPFILYGAAHKDQPIVITYVLWFIANIVVAIGAMIYK